MTEISFERDKKNRIIVPETLRRPHPLTKQTKEAFKSCEPNELGIVELPKEDCLDIRVSKKTRIRALRIMDALIKALDSRGYDVSLSNRGTVTKLLDVTLGISLSEEFETQRTQPKKRDLDGYYRFGHSRYDTTRVPSGKLCLTIKLFGHYYSGRRNWRDSKTKQLEDCLNAFVIGLLRTAVWEKQQIEEKREKERQRQEWLRKREEEKRLRAEKKQRFENELTKVTGLISDAENWQKSKLIREYIAEVERQILAGTCVFEPQDGYSEWIKWAKKQADRLDPMTLSPKSILDEPIEEEKEDNTRNRYPHYQDW